MGLFSNFMRNTGREPVSVGVNYLIQADSLVAKVAEFIGKLETEESANWCKCLWRIHPNDQGIKPGCCRICNTPKALGKHGYDTPGNHTFRGIRKTMVDQHPMCTVHTKEGLIIGFIEWIANDSRN